MGPKVYLPKQVEPVNLSRRTLFVDDIFQCYSLAPHSRYYKYNVFCLNVFGGKGCFKKNISERVKKRLPVRVAFWVIRERILFSLSVRSKHVDDLVHVHLLHVVTSRTEVLTRVELTWLLSESLTDSSRHSQTRVRVDVDLANG